MDISIRAIVLTAILLHLAACAPQKRWYPGTLTILPQQKRTCEEFEFSICNKIGYNTTSLPNKRNHTTIEKAAAELDDFEMVMSSKCSNYVATLFCFTYFPFCDLNQWESLDIYDKNDYEPIYPCRDACRRVTEECRAEFELQSQGYEWPRVFQNCDTFPETNCAMGPDPEDLTEPDVESPDTTDGGDVDENGVPDENGDDENEGRTDMAEPTPTPTEVIRRPADCSKVSDCSPRTRCTSNFFKRKDHDFAAKVIFTGEVYLESSIKQYQGQVNARAFTFDRENITQYPLLSECSLQVAPPLQQYSHIYTNTPEGCDNCFDIEFGTEYLIAGHYDSTEDKFELRRQNGLLALWADKNERSIPKYISAGNQERRAKISIC